MYAIAATVTREDGSVRSLPTFFLDRNVQGILTTAHAEKIAREVIDPFGQYADQMITAVLL